MLIHLKAYELENDISFLKDKFCVNIFQVIGIYKRDYRFKKKDLRTPLHKLLTSPKLSDCPLLVLANKSDAGGMSVAEMSAFLALNKIQGRQWAIEGCSAISGKGIPVGVDYITYIGYIKDKVPVPPGVNPFRD